MISVEGVTRRFGSLVAVNQVSFEVSRGEVVGFLGPNGAGKTTTMRMLTGTLQPDEGIISFDGQPIAENLRAAKTRVGYLPEANPLYGDMLVCEYLEFVADLRNMTADAGRQGIRDAVAETNLKDVFFRPISELSKGYKQRTGMAAAILHRPEILILDEPTEGLDPSQRVEIRRLVQTLGSERTVLLSTHVMQEVESTCSRLLIIREGSIAADGTVAELMEAREGLTHYVVEAKGEGLLNELSALPGVTGYTVKSVSDRQRVRLAVDPSVELRPIVSELARQKGWELWELHRERATLEQMFRELTESEEEDSSDVYGPGQDEDDDHHEAPQ